VHVKARAEQLVADARQALNEDASTERMRSLTSDLQQASQSVAQSRGAAQQGAAAGDGEAAPRQPQGSDDDVIDADFTVS